MANPSVVPMHKMQFQLYHHKHVILFFWPWKMEPFFCWPFLYFDMSTTILVSLTIQLPRNSHGFGHSMESNVSSRGWILCSC